MKKLVLVVISMLFVFGATGLVFADKDAKGMFSAKAGDQIYVCACGETCDCGTMGHKEGNCTCGKEMVKATVTKVENGKVFYRIGDKELSAPQKGKYMCGCGETCDCGYVSQKAGNCGCGKPMVNVK